MLGFMAAMDWAGVVAMCGSSRVTADELARVIREYGCTPCLPPDNYAEFVTVDQYLDGSEAGFFIVAPLWTVEEGRSDLSVEVTACWRGGQFALHLHDLHVL